MTSHLPSIASAFILTSLSLQANTIAYWRFEGDGLTPPIPGTTQVEDSDGRTSTTTGVGSRAIDVSGNGNTVWAWEHPWAGHVYATDVPYSTVPQSNEANLFSVQNTGDYPAMFTWSSHSSPTGVNLDTWTSLTWTIEASFKCTDLNGWRTFVGRDGNGVSNGNAAAAPIYFQKMGDGSNRVRISYVDAAGNEQIAIDPTAITANTWYSYAASCDGTTLKLYRKTASDAAYLMVASTNVSGSANPALVNPGNDQNGEPWCWTLGRGRYGTNDDPSQDHGDRWFGYLDEIRISDVALPPGALLGVSSGGDADGDDLPDAWETAHGLDPNSAIGINGKLGDFDGDGWSNFDEFNMGTDPSDPLAPGAANGDYDHDGLDDKWEVQWFGSTTTQNGTDQSDGDGANNLAEYLAGSNPTSAASTPGDVNGNGTPDSVAILDFSAAAGSIADLAGVNTGFTTRLTNTGTDPSFTPNDPNLHLNTANGTLEIKSTSSDLNGQNGLATAEMPGLRLSSLGFTGSQDFKVRAKFINLPATGGADQIGIFAGTSSTAAIRGGLITSDTGLGVNTNGNNDSDAVFMPGNLALRAGISMTVELSRIAGVWHMTANGVDITPTAQPTFLDSASDLIVGVYVTDLFSGGSKTATLDSFSVVCFDATSGPDGDHDGMLDSWEIAKFGDTSHSGTEDADHDGFSNFTEFAFGGNPVDAASHGATTMSTSDTNANSLRDLTLTVLVRTGAVFSADGNGQQVATVDGVTYRIRGTLDLVQFNQAVSHVGVIPSEDPAYELHMFRLDASEGLPGKGFLQATATSP